MRDIIRISAALVLAATTLTTGSSVAAASSASSARIEDAARDCPGACAMIYQPVRCLLSNGALMTFGNRCAADEYACRHGLDIVACEPPRTPG